MTLRFPFFHTTDVQALVEALAVRDARIQKLENTVAELKQTIARQAPLIAELERRLGLNSTTISKPPSSDGLRKPRAPKRSRVKGRKPGGQKGQYVDKFFMLTNDSISPSKGSLSLNLST